MKENVIIWSGDTHTGSYRRKNEDNIASCDLNEPNNPKIHLQKYSGKTSSTPNGAAFAIADGMGGGLDGDKASWVALREFMHWATFLPKLSGQKLNVGEGEIWQDWENAMHEIFSLCHKAVEEEGEKAMLVELEKRRKKALLLEGESAARNISERGIQKMGSTLSAVWIIGNIARIAHIGDSRIYHLRPSRVGKDGFGALEDLTLLQVSEDHSFVGAMRRQGKLNEREARNHPRRSSLMQALGCGIEDIFPQIKQFEIKSRDSILICSDGLNDGLWDRNIGDAFYAYFYKEKKDDLRELSDICLELRDYLIGKAVRLSGRDNISAQVLHFV